MVLPHADNAVSALVENSIGVAVFALPTYGHRRNRFGRHSRKLTVQSLVPKIREVDHPVGHYEGAAAVFVDSSPHAERPGRQVVELSVRRTLHQDMPAFFRRTRFHPVDIRAVQGQLPQTHAFPNDEVRAYGRFPGAERRRLPFCNRNPPASRFDLE